MRLNVREKTKLEKSGPGRYKIYIDGEFKGELYSANGRWYSDYMSDDKSFLSRREAILAIGTLSGVKPTSDLCVVCGQGHPDEYFVSDALWREAGLTTGYCHIRCLEKLLGRRLTLEDFPPHILNEKIRANS